MTGSTVYNFGNVVLVLLAGFVAGAQLDSVACDFHSGLDRLQRDIGICCLRDFWRVYNFLDWHSYNCCIFWHCVVTACWWNSLCVVQFTIICLVSNCDFSLR